MRYIFTIEYYLDIKNDVKFASKWVGGETRKISILSVMTQIQKDKYGVYPVIPGFLNDNQTTVCQRGYV